MICEIVLFLAGWVFFIVGLLLIINLFIWTVYRVVDFYCFVVLNISHGDLQKAIWLVKKEREKK